VLQAVISYLAEITRLKVTEWNEWGHCKHGVCTV